MKINLRLGDWSGDGHGQTSVYTIESNLTSDEIEKAYRKGTELVKFDLTNDICSEYEDDLIPIDIVDRCVLAGIKMPQLEDEEDDAHRFSNNEVGFVQLYCEIVKLGNPSFTYEFIKNEFINIGGYGLFYV